MVRVPDGQGIGDTTGMERTIIRKPADAFRADVLRGERSAYEGDTVTLDPDLDRCAYRFTKGAPLGWEQCAKISGHAGKHIPGIAWDCKHGNRPEDCRTCAMEGVDGTYSLTPQGWAR